MATDVLLIAEAHITTVQLLDQVLAFLRENTPLRARTRLLHELRPEDFTAETYPLIVRSFNAEAYGLTKVLRRHGIPYGYYLDDNFWLLDTDTEIGRLYAERTQRRRLESVVEHASTVIASTPLLSDFVRSRNDNVIQLDSFFDFSLIPKLPSAPPDRPIVRGGYAASADRVQDLIPVLAEVIDVLDTHENVEFEIIGAAKADFPRHPRIRFFPYKKSYAEYIAFQRSRQWDFGLAPLGGAASNLYKTDNKFREYAAQGIPGIYQEAPPYSSVRDGETGLLAGKSHTWREAMHRYIADPGLRSRVRRDARVDAERRCALENVAPQWETFFASVPPSGVSAEQIEKVRRAVGVRGTDAIRAARRSRLLWDYGRTQIADHGILSTAGRTARFLRNRITRRPPERP